MLFGDEEQFKAYETNEKHSFKGLDLHDEEYDVFLQFNEETKFDEITFKLGMELSSIKISKNIIKDFHIHLGKQVK